MEYKPRYLVMVTASANNNKYYKQIPNADGQTWTAEYGRVGNAPQKATYYMKDWDKKYREKIKKGYVDQTDLAEDLMQAEKPKNEIEYKAIENKIIAEIVDRLQAMARDAIQRNYTIKSDKVTQAMVDEAQNLITELADMSKNTSDKSADKDLKDFNEKLLKLFTTIPRKMSNVNQHLAKSNKDFNKILTVEQDLLDVMRGQVVQHVAAEEDSSAEKLDITILEKLGLEFEECDNEDIAVIRTALGNSSDKFKRAWRVKNIKTQERFDKFVKENNIEDIKLLFHGSRNENWWSIIQTGLVLRPTNAIITGKMFGYGLYYAPKAQKSIGYTSLQGSYWTGGGSKNGFMALMQVAYGKPYNVDRFDSKYYNFNYEALQKACPGANCLHAHAGEMLRNDEIIVYKEEQCSIKYLIELE